MQPHSLIDLHQCSEKLNLIKEAAPFSETAQIYQIALENITGDVLISVCVCPDF
jgi:hypothetical protein